MPKETHEPTEKEEAEEQAGANVKALSPKPERCKKRTNIPNDQCRQYHKRNAWQEVPSLDNRPNAHPSSHERTEHGVESD